MLVAAGLGGEARSPAEFCASIERISIADGSVGWVASFGVAAAYLAALPVQTLRHIYAGGPDVIFAGAMFPPQPTRRTADGLGVTGRWPFGSGSTGADLVGVGITVADLEDGKLPRCAVMQASDVTIAPNWDVIGLQGTGSHDIVVDNVIVSDAWVFVRGGRPSIPAAVYRYPTVGTSGTGPGRGGPRHRARRARRDHGACEPTHIDHRCASSCRPALCAGRHRHERGRVASRTRPLLRCDRRGPGRMSVQARHLTLLPSRSCAWLRHMPRNARPM